jgi:hypothetical protein
MKQKLSVTVSNEVTDKMDELIKSLPKKIVNDKPQKITKSSIIELYSNIIHNYFDLNQLSIEYELLDIADGRRKNNSVSSSTNENY